MSNTNHDFIVKNGLVVGSAITSTGTLTQAGQTFPASDGSANQYLKTNGSGALSWGTVNTSFNITDGTTTDAVGLTETVTFTGGTNISLAVTDNTVTITNDVTDTDDITEGSSNLFYTDTRAVDAVEGHAHLTIDGGTLYVDTANNYVGIGDTSPSGKLDVAGNIMINGSEVINASGNIVGAVADSAMTVGGSLAGVLSNIKVQYGTAYSGTPIQGSFFFDSLNQKLKVYTGSAFIDAVPAGSGGGGGGGATDANTTFRNYSYTLTGTTSAVSGVDDNELTAGAFIIGHKYTITATGNTNFVTIGAANSNVNTVFTATGVGTGTGTAKQTLFYDTTSSATRVVAYVNGIKQVYGSGRDFVATTGTSVAFTYNLGSGDTVDLQVYELLTNAAYYVKSEVYTQAEVNSQISTGVSAYLPLAGGTLTGLTKINTTSTTAPSSVDLVAGGGIHSNYASDIALSYRAGTYSNYYKGMSGKNPYNDVGRGLHIFNYDNDSDTGINFWSGSSESSSLYSIANFEAGATGEVVFNGSGLNRDFRVESDSNSHALWVDADAERLLIGKSNNALGAAGHTFGLDGYLYHTRNGDIMWLNCLASSGTAITFMQNSATKGSITVNSTATTYNTTSDRRLKDNIKPISDATDKLMDMKPVTHTWIDNPDEPQVHGFIAQEMQDVIPEAVSGDAESDEMMSMDYGRITPVIVAALQDALKEIEELKTRIDELENK